MLNFGANPCLDFFYLLCDGIVWIAFIQGFTLAGLHGHKPLHIRMCFLYFLALFCTTIASISKPACFLTMQQGVRLGYIVYVSGCAHYRVH